MAAGDGRQLLIQQQGGEQHVAACLAFAVWFCQQLVDSCEGFQHKVSGQLTLNSHRQQPIFAHWSSSNVLTLALDQPCFWQEPFGGESLCTFIHEAAHAMNMHHGYEFRQEMERLAGVGSSLMFHRGSEVRSLFPQLLSV
jgi:hypothetical protein